MAGKTKEKIKKNAAGSKWVYGVRLENDLNTYFRQSSRIAVQPKWDMVEVN